MLLEAIKVDLGDEAVVMGDLPDPPDVSLVDAVGGDFSEALELLSRVGLNDAYLFLRKYSELSAGQRYRFRLAQMISSGKEYWLCDEFCSLLDRTTARIVAYSMQKHARRVGASLIVATSHTDLLGDLNPDTRIIKGWGDEVMIKYDHPVPRGCSISDEITIEEGNRGDYDRLKYLHYRGGALRFTQRFYRMMHDETLVGVIAYKYPLVRTQGRKEAVGYVPNVDELNRDWSLISRVIIHPKYRGIGLGSRLISETLQMQPCKHVELVAVMALYNPFAERAGMRLIKKTEPDSYVLKAINGLRKLGFDPSKLGSRRYNRTMLESFNDIEPVWEDICKIKGGIQYRRISRARRSFAKKSEFIDWVHRQDLDSLAWSIQILSVLAQSKAYLYWCRMGEGGGV
nr:hypothetical protein 4 [Moraxellaceae bacterium]